MVRLSPVCERSTRRTESTDRPTMNSETCSGPLDGVRVLDLSRLLPGPFATMVLGDLGAIVDKLEDPREGDYLRRLPPSAPDGMNTVFHDLNRGKRSVVLDLKQPEGRDVFLTLIERYDVLVESFRPGVMDRLGVGWETLRQRHPGLVYCAITGYGQSGPLKDRAGHDLNYLARAGVLGLTGPADAPPQVPGVQAADIGGGSLHGVIGILAALHERSRTGRGSFVDVSICEGALSMAAFGFGALMGGMHAGRGRDVLTGGIAAYQTYETKDGRYVALAALEPKFWVAFCRGVGLEPNLRALVPGPHQEGPDGLKAKIRAVFRTKTQQEWVAFADATDCCLEPVLSPDEALVDPQHAARGVFVRGAGFLRTRTPAAPAAGGRAPTQGEHTTIVLREAGMTNEAIERLRARGVVGG